MPEKYLANELIFGNPDSKKYSAMKYSADNDLSSFRNRLVTQLREQPKHTYKIQHELLGKNKGIFEPKSRIKEVSPLEKLYEELDNIAKGKTNVQSEPPNY